MPEPKPARTCIGVAELPAGGTDVEIEFVAYDGQDVSAYYTEKKKNNECHNGDDKHFLLNLPLQRQRDICKHTMSLPPVVDELVVTSYILHLSKLFDIGYTPTNP